MLTILQPILRDLITPVEWYSRVSFEFEYDIISRTYICHKENYLSMAFHKAMVTVELLFGSIFVARRTSINTIGNSIVLSPLISLLCKQYTGVVWVLESYGSWKYNFPGPGKFWKREDFQKDYGKMSEIDEACCRVKPVLLNYFL